MTDPRDDTGTGESPSDPSDREDRDIGLPGDDGSLGDRDEVGPSAPELQTYDLPAPHEDLELDTLVRTYGPLRGYFRYRVDEYGTLDAALRALRHDDPVDTYLARSARHAALGGIAGVCIGLFIAVTVLRLMDGRRAIMLALLAPVAGAALGVVGTWFARLYSPRLRARRRGRAADLMLPHAVTYLYALSHGGVNLFEAIQRLAEAQDVYNPPAETFGDVVSDVETFNRSLPQALSAARERSPSDEMAAFLDELVAVVDTGGDVDAFLENEADRRLEYAKREQEGMIESLGTMAEIYITLVFAGPLFLLVILLVGSFMSPGLLFPVQLVVYGLIPASILTTGYLIAWLYRPFRQQIGVQRTDAMMATVLRSGPEAGHDNQRIAEYVEHHRRERRFRVVETPVAAMRERPALTLLVTVPVGATVTAMLLLGGIIERATDSPAVFAAATFTAPFLIAAVPFSYLHERQRRYERTVRNRFPDALDVLADADANDVPVADAFGIVATRTSGVLSAEFDRLRRDVAWTHDVDAALRRFADRLSTPSITRICRSLRDSLSSTDDLEPIFAVVADDLRTRNEIRAKRRQQMQPYAVVTTIGVLVFLAIAVFFDTYFLPTIAELSGESSEALAGTALDVGSVPVDTYQELFVHATLIQAFCNGLLLGKLVDDSLASGVKYAAALVGVCTGVLVVVM